MTIKPITREDDVAEMAAVLKSVVRTVDDLPLFARLEFVKNIIFDHGGSRGSLPEDPMLIIATDVIEDVVKTLKGEDLRRPFNADDTPVDRATKWISHAIDDLPLLPRLQFAKNIICDRGGIRGEAGSDDMVIIAAEVLGNITKFVKEDKALASLRP
jgi:hypothetical protein